MHSKMPQFLGSHISPPSIPWETVKCVDSGFKLYGQHNLENMTLKFVYLVAAK